VSHRIAEGLTSQSQVVLAFLSVVLDAISLVLVSLSKTYQQVLGCE
jgi:hypothetical protein